MLKKLILFILIFAITFSVSACGKNDSPDYEPEPDEISVPKESSEAEDVSEPEEHEFGEEDAKKLVQWALDMAYKGIVSEESAEILGITREEAEDEYIETVIYGAELIYTLISEDKYIEDALLKCCYIMDDIYSQIDYTVTDAVKTEDYRFEVTVDVRPINLTGYLTAELEKAVKESGEDFANEGSEERLALIIFNIIESFSKNVEYKETETFTVIVRQNSDGKWIINEEEISILTSALMGN